MSDFLLNIMASDVEDPRTLLSTHLHNLLKEKGIKQNSSLYKECQAKYQKFISDLRLFKSSTRRPGEGYTQFREKLERMSVLSDNRLIFIDNVLQDWTKEELSRILFTEFRYLSEYRF